MNRNYLPPSLMGHAPPPDTTDVMMVTVPSSPGATSAGEGPTVMANTNGSQSQQHQVHPLFSGYQTLPRQQHHPQAASLVNVSCTFAAASGGASGPANAGTRRSISFTGGVPIANSSIGGHAFLSHQYTHMLPPAVPQVAHQSTIYPQIAQGQSGSNLGYVTSPAHEIQPPTRVGRMDRLSRTCKLPTVQEVGKLRLAGSSSSSSYSSSSSTLSSSQARSTTTTTAKSNHRSLCPGRKCLTIQ